MTKIACSTDHSSCRLFSSGKQQAFQCLVCLHRHNQGTLSQMPGQYAITLHATEAESA